MSKEFMATHKELVIKAAPDFVRKAIKEEAYEECACICEDVWREIGVEAAAYEHMAETLREKKKEL